MTLINHYSLFKNEVGCDEVGRGCLAGPVVAAAVIIDEKFQQHLINDSKKLNKKTRLELDQYIRTNALDFAIAEVSSQYIDEHNILNASIHAMHLALLRLKSSFDYILVDGNKFYPYQNIPHECIIKGDSKILSIASASILAKNYRDDLMSQLHEDYPQYAWNKNAGYPTKAHRDAIKKFGTTPYHRMSFKLL